MNNNNNIGWLFFGGYKNILPSMLTILPSSSTQAILLTSLVIYSCIPLKAIHYYIIIPYELLNKREHQENIISCIVEYHATKNLFIQTHSKVLSTLNTVPPKKGSELRIMDISFSPVFSSKWWNTNIFLFRLSIQSDISKNRQSARTRVEIWSRLPLVQNLKRFSQSIQTVSFH